MSRPSLQMVTAGKFRVVTSLEMEGKVVLDVDFRTAVYETGSTFCPDPVQTVVMI